MHLMVSTKWHNTLNKHWILCMYQAKLKNLIYFVFTCNEPSHSQPLLCFQTWNCFWRVIKFSKYLLNNLKKKKEFKNGNGNIFFGNLFIRSAWKIILPNFWFVCFFFVGCDSISFAYGTIFLFTYQFISKYHTFDILKKTNTSNITAVCVCVFALFMCMFVVVYLFLLKTCCKFKQQKEQRKKCKP